MASNHGRNARLTIAAVLPVLIGSASSEAATHFVTADGSATSDCSSNDPCTITRAVELTGGATIPPGSEVAIAEGIYSQEALVIEGSGTADLPIKFVGQGTVRFTGSRVKPAASAWTLVPGRQYTYQLDWDEATQGGGQPVQRPPVEGWRPIWVEDRKAPFTNPSSRRFDLWFPPLYSGRTSIDEVEAQAGTSWFDTVNNKIYVHLFDDGPPTEGKNVYLRTGGWGTVTIEGDHIWLENVTIEHASPIGLLIKPSADGTVLQRITALAAPVRLEGVDTLAEDLDISHVIAQRTDPSECYDANPEFGVGECWNANGIGHALSVGKEASTASHGQVVRRAFVHRSWNGGSVHGANTLEDSLFWGFPNHTLGGAGTGVTIRNNVFLNGQDSIYWERNPFDDVTIEHNLFVHGALFWVSDNVGGDSGNAGGVPLTTGFRFHHNILPGIVFDDKVTPALTADCNLYIRPGEAIDRLFLISGTDGRASVRYETLEALQAGTPFEANSVLLPSSAWRDGSQFARYTAQSALEFDFHPASPDAQALNMPAACGDEPAGPTDPYSPFDEGPDEGEGGDDEGDDEDNDGGEDDVNLSDAGAGCGCRSGGDGAALSTLLFGAAALGALFGRRRRRDRRATPPETGRDA